ncbi:MAG: dockerin type I repeat-containing protein [Oscillospiraceae bacterium]|nr:dockerin type I repeat-containing protein [Oscillospiraceae bacterium]
MKKFLSLLLAIFMVVGMFPMAAFAEETNILDETEIIEETEVSEETEVHEEADVTDEAPVPVGTVDLQATGVSEETNDADDNGDEKKIYEVIVKAAPSGAEIKFYSGSDAETEITEGITDNGIVDGYHKYTFVAEEGMYSYRAWEGDQFLGGMEFEVPIDDEYASDGTLMGKGQVLTLKRVNFLTTSEHITKTEDYTVHLIPQDLREAVNGTNYVNENGNVVCPIMVNAGGNALTYNLIIDVNGELGNTYAVSAQQHLTFNPGTTTETREFAVNELTWFTITAPAEAKVQMFQQYNNYNVKEILCSRTETLDDGTVKNYFATAGGQYITYRVSMDDKITRAGFTSVSNKDLVFTFKDNEDPKTTQTTALRIENSSLLNVNTQNNLKMSVGETFRLRSFRAGWQIINTDTANIMIEPDFHYNIISGAEHIRMTPVADKTTGNAGTGENTNWMDIEALSEGTVILEVSYDAIQISGDTSYPGLFGACGEDGKSVVVINIGSDKENTLEITPVHGTHKVEVWDAEFDRLYFFGETADFNFTSNMGGTVELSTDLGNSWKTVSQNGDGVYEAKGLVHGSNILRVTENGNVQYQVVRASRLGVTIVNMTRPGDETIVVGDTIRVLFSNIYTTVPKMSGIYNPGFGKGHAVTYTIPEGVTAKASGSQYGFAADNMIEIVFSEAGTFNFEDGYIHVSVLGDKLGGHRKLTDSGRGVNFNAGGSDSNRCIVPDISFEVIEMPVVNVTVKSDPEGAEIEVSDKSGVIEANEDGTYSLIYGTYSYSAKMEGYVPEYGEFSVGGGEDATGKKTVVIAMRELGGAIWDGKTQMEPEKDENGVYLIQNGYELSWFASNHNNANAKLVEDISLGGFGVSISNYTGTFDGNGHYITDFYGQSLFQRPGNGAVIKNLGVSGIVVQNSTHWTGAQGGIVANGFSTMADFTVENCVSRVNVTGTGPCGGIASFAESQSSMTMPKIKNCYNTGTVVTNGGYPGGIGGVNDSNPILHIENCYNLGVVSGDKAYGVARNGRGTIRNNYTLLGAAANAGGTALTGDTLKTYAETLGDAFMDNPTSYNDGYPILKWEEPRARAVLQEECIAELVAYESGESFTAAAAEKLAKAIEEGKKAIMEAGSFAEVEEALEQAKAAIDAIDPFEGTDALPGDVNGDGSVNVFDLIKLREYLLDSSADVSIENADLNYDGKVNIFDLIALRDRLLG